MVFFAIAFAVHAALGNTIEAIEFNQYEMREHTVNCFRNGLFTPFPTVFFGEYLQDWTTFQAKRLNCIVHVECQRHLTTWSNATYVKNGFTYHVRELYLLLQLMNSGCASSALYSSCIFLSEYYLFMPYHIFEVTIEHHTCIHYQQTCDWEYAYYEL